MVFMSWILHRKVLINILLAAFFAAFGIFVNGQTGPGGVGNFDGSNNQPRNVLWLDASSLSLTDGVSVETWSDISGNAYDASNTTTAEQPEFVQSSALINNKSLIRFYGLDAADNDHLDLPSELGTTQDGVVGNNYTFFVVAGRRAAGENWILGGNPGGPANGNLGIGWRSNNNFAQVHWGNDIDVGTGAQLTATGQLGIFTADFNVSKSPSARKVFENSQLQNTRNNNTALGQWNTPTLGMFAGGRWADVDIAEVIFFNEAVSDAQRIIIENYLGAKYGIALAVNDYFSLGDASYHYDVAGIGQGADGLTHGQASSAGFYIDTLASISSSDYILFGHSNTTDNSVVVSDITGSVEERWSRDWYVQKTNYASGNIRVVFDIPEGIAGGDFPQNISNYVLLYRAGTSGNYTPVTTISTAYGDIDQVAFEVANADLVNGYYTLGTTDQTNSPVAGAEGTNFYSLTSGAWNDPSTWTLDPAGVLPLNPGNTYPQLSTDNATIKSGKTVTVSNNNIDCYRLTVEGRLDLSNTTGHSFQEIRGDGKILLQGDNFPTGDASHFVTVGQGEGTVEFYGGNFTMASNYTFYNLIINLNTPFNSVLLANNLTVNGDFTLEQGWFQINDNSSTTILNIEVDGDLSVSANASLRTGLGNTIGTYSIGTSLPSVGNYHNIYHQLTIGGNFTNNGVVRFTNQPAPDYSQFTTTGAVTVRFIGAQNSRVDLYGTTDFYNLIVEKGTDASNTLELYSDNADYFTLYGPNSVGHNEGSPFSQEDPEIRKALWIYRGKLKLTGEVNIPTLCEYTTSGRGNWAIGANAALQLAGPNVTVYTTAQSVDEIPRFTSGDLNPAVGVVAGGGNQALTVLGELQLTNGFIGTRNSAGVIYFPGAAANIIIEGGNLETYEVRSTGTGTGITTWTQSGGYVTITGDDFEYQNADLIFNMSGGTMELQQGDFLVGSAEGNYNVTGGIVFMNTNTNVNINSTANIFNLNLQARAGTPTIFMQANLVVSNDLTIGDDILLNHQGNDLNIGRNLTIAAAGDLFYDAGTPNTTTIDGSFDSQLAFYNRTGDANDEQYFQRFIINKPSTRTVSLESGKADRTGNNNNLISFSGTSFQLLSGIFDQGGHSVRMYTDSVVNYGTLGVYNSANATPDGTENGNNDLVKFRPDPFVLITTDGAQFGNVRLNSGAEIVTLTSNVYMQRLEWRHGRMDLGTYNLTLDELYVNLNAGQTLGGLGLPSVEDMFITAGNASDGGLSIYVPSTGLDPTEGDNVFEFPLGIGTDGIEVGSGGNSKYTPALVTVNTVNDDGYITLRPVNQALSSLSGGTNNSLQYYWRIDHSDFTTVPDIQLQFDYIDSDVDGAEASYVPGRIIDFITREEDAGGSVDRTNDIIYFSNGPLTTGDYTAGNSSKFNGTVRVLYARKNGEWHDYTTWSTTRDGSSPLSNATQLPGPGDICVVGTNTTNYAVAVSSTHADYAPIQIASLVILRYGGGESSLVTVGQNGADCDFGLVTNRDLDAADPLSTIDHSSKIIVSGPTLPSGDFGEFMTAPNTLWTFSRRFPGSNSAIDDTDGGNLANVTYPSYTVGNTITEYPVLQFEFSADGGGYIETPAVDITVNNDIRFFKGATNLLINNSAAGGDITVKDDITFNGGSSFDIVFPATGTARTITVEGDFDFDNAANSVISVENAAGALENTLQIIGSIINPSASSQINFYNGATNSLANLEFSGSGNSIMEPFTTIPELNRIIVNKDTRSDSVYLNSNFNFNYLADGAIKPLTLRSGSAVINNAAINEPLTTGNEAYPINSNSLLEIRLGQMSCSGNSGVELDGKLLVSGGNLDMSGGDNYIEYTASGNSELEITAGSLIVGSQLRRGTVSTTGILKYTQSGGTAVFGENTAPVINRGVFEILGNGSEFNHLGGDLYIARALNSGGFSALYLNPETYNLATGTSINFGYTTTPLNSTIRIYSLIPLKGFIVNNSSGNFFQTYLNADVEIEEDLAIQGGPRFYANRDVYLGGDLIANGAYTAYIYTLYLNGTNDQTFTGATTQYNLVKTGSQNLILDVASGLNIKNTFSFDGGDLIDNGNNVAIQGNVYFNGLHQHGGSGLGIYLYGSSAQILEGNGTIGKLSINNANGVNVPVGNEFTITNSLRLQNGVLNINNNLLTLGLNSVIEEASPFSVNNMIRTNMSFTDDGVKKILPAGASIFTFPMGSVGKYTPVTFDITSNANSTGSITVVPANERHPSIQEDAEAPDPEINDSANVLQYHWVLKADGVSGFTADAEMKYHPADALVTAPYALSDYITARLLSDGSGAWAKYDKTSFDESNENLLFFFSNNDDASISGEYTAGVDSISANGAIPDNVPFNETNQSGDWTNGTIWDPNVSGGPRGASVRINFGHDVIVPSNFISSYTTEIIGSLAVGTTFGHRLGAVSGVGTLSTEIASLPAGSYTDFFAPTGGILEYTGTTDYDVLGGITALNSLVFSGTGDRRLPNTDVTLYGDLSISGASAALIVRNENNRTINLQGDLTFTDGSFVAGTGASAEMVFSGSAPQTITGNFTTTNAFNHFEINNNLGVSLAGDIETNGTLEFTSGLITTNANTVRITSTGSVSPASGTSSSYVNGTLIQEKPTGLDFTFPIGSSAHRRIVSIISPSGYAGSDDWQASYQYTNPSNDGYTISSVVVPLTTVSAVEFWTLQGPAGAQSNLSFTLEGISDIAAGSNFADLRVARWNGVAWELVGGIPATTGDSLNGTITTTTPITFSGGAEYFTLASVDPTPLATASFSSGDAQICDDGSDFTVVEITLTGTGPWNIVYTRDGANDSIVNGIGASPYTFVSTIPGHYALQSVSDLNGPGVIVGDSIEVVLNALPTVFFTGLDATYVLNAPGDVLTGNQAPQGTFSGPGIVDNGNGTAIFNPVTPGTNSITYSYTDPTTGCSYDSTLQTFVLGTPEILFATDSSSVNEDIGIAQIAVILEYANPGSDVTVDYAVSGGTATGLGIDYTLTSGTLTIAAGDTVNYIDVIITDDGIDELDETIEITILNPTIVTLGDTTVHTLTILDNDPPPTISFTSATMSAMESISPVQFVVNLSGPSSFDVSFDYATSDGTATSGIGNDYEASSGTITIPAGETSDTFNVTIYDDVAEEVNETFTVTLSNFVNGTAGTFTTITHSIMDNDGLGWEGPGGVGNFTNQVDSWLNTYYSTNLSDGQKVTVAPNQWVDLTGNGIDAFQNNGTNEPTFYDVSPVWNGRPVILFNSAANEFLKIADNNRMNTAPGGQSKRTIIVAFRTGTDITSRQVIFEEGGGARGLNIYLEAGTLYIGGWNLPNDDATTPWPYTSVQTPITANSPYFAILQFDFDDILATGEVRGSLNGTDLGVLAGAGKLFTHPGDIGLGAMNQGACYDDGTCPGGTDYYFDGYIAEFISGNIVYNQARLNIVHNYLAAKYGITLPGGEDLYDYQLNHGYEVFGLGQEDGSNFHNMAQGLGIVYIENPTNMTDGTYMLMGHNNGTVNTWVNTEVPNNDANIVRVNREWRVDKQGGDLGDIDIRIDNTQFGTYFGSYTTYVLLIDDDGNFTGGSRSVELVADGPGHYRANGVSLNKGDYITIARVRPAIQFSQAASSVNESDGTLDVEISMNFTSNTDITVDYSSAPGTATGGGTDYTNLSGTFTLPAGDTAGTITVSINDDAILESDEDFTITIINPSAGINIGTNNIHTVTIQDNDNTRKVQFTADSVSGVEATSPVIIELHLTENNPSNPVDVDYNVLVGGTAAAGGVDYDLVSTGTITFVANDTLESLPAITITDDLLDENDETILIELSNPTNSNLGDTSQFVYTIVDDDPEPAIGFEVASASGAESLSPVQLIIRLSEISGKDITVDHAISGGTATGGGVDFLLNDNTVTIPAGIDSVVVLLDIFNDNVEEPNEDIEITLSNPINATLGANSTFTYTIIDDDGLGWKGPGGVGNISTQVNAWLRTTDPSLPTDIPPLSDGIEVGNGNYTWRDMSENGHDAFQNVAANRPTYYDFSTTWNGRPIIQFDRAGNNFLDIADNDDMNTPSGAQTQRTIIVAFRPSTNVTDRQVIYEEGGGVRGLNIYLEGGILYIGGWNDANDDAGATTPWSYTTVNTPITANTPYFAILQFDFDDVAGTGEVRGSVNGVDLGALPGAGKLFNHPGDIGIGGQSNGACYVGDCSGNDNYFFDGYIAELVSGNIVYNSAQMKIVHNYLAAKFGIALPPADDIYSYDASHSYELFGIGQENLANSHYIAQGSGLVRIENPGNAGDGRYLTIGHDGNGISSWLDNGAIDVPNNDANIERVERVWRVDKQGGDLGSIKFSIDTTALPVRNFGFTKYVLLIDDDGDFTDARRVVELVKDGGEYHSLDAVNFAAGEYFTIGIVQPTIQFVDAASSDQEFVTTADPASPQIAIELNYETRTDVTVNYSTSDGSAIAGSDYTAVSGTATVVAGRSTDTISVAIINDTDVESDETFDIDLSGPMTGVQLGTNTTHTFTIHDDDNARKIQFTIDSVSGLESVTPVTINVEINIVDAANPTTVDYTVTGGDAVGGDDFILADGTVTVPANSMVASLPAVVIVDDAINETDETFTITLSNPTNSNLDTILSYTYTIQDNDAAPSVSFSSTTQGGSESFNPAYLELVLSSPSGVDITVDYSAADGTATGGGIDYRLIPGTFTIPAGIDTALLPVEIVNDIVEESQEDFTVSIANPFNAALGANTSLDYTIYDDDGLGYIGPGGVGNETQYQVWFKVDEEAYTNGNPVDQLNDLSGNGNDAASAGGNRPTFTDNVSNGRPGARFDGTNDYLEFADDADINTGTYTQKTLVVAFRTGGDVTSRQVIYEQGGGSNGLNIYIEGDNLYFGAWALTYGWPFVSVSSPIAINTEYYAILELDTENQVLKGVLNGTTVGTVALDTDDALGPHGGDCALGAQRNASYFHSVGGRWWCKFVLFRRRYNGVLVI
jgi:hypothetical protein